MILIANNDVSCNLIIIQSFNHHEDASLALWALFYISMVLDSVIKSSDGSKVEGRIVRLFYYGRRRGFSPTVEDNSSMNQTTIRGHGQFAVVFCSPSP